MSIFQLFSRSRGLRIGLALLVLAIIFTRRTLFDNSPSEQPGIELRSTNNPDILSAGFVITDRVFNSELMAPYDVLHHSIFRDKNHYIEPFIISEDGGPVTSFEGITVVPHFSFETAPPVDILVIPSAEGSMTYDLQNERYMNWLSTAVENAQYVVSLCDGAFPLAATRALNGKIATTFPGDRDAFATRFRSVEVQYDVRFVHDDKFITSVGGGMSYEPALYLVEMLYGKEHARETARGLVWDWELGAVPHLIAN